MSVDDYQDILIVKDIKKNPDDPNMLPAQAKAFTERYEVLAPTHTTDAGLQVNVFRDRVTGDPHFAIAGTQFQTDTYRDLVIADGSIALGAAPKDQVLDAVNYLNRVIAPKGEPAPQVKWEVIEADTVGEFGEPITVSAWGIVRAPAADGLGLIPSGTLPVISGDYSLAGVIGTAVHRITGASLNADGNAFGAALSALTEVENFFKEAA